MRKIAAIAAIVASSCAPAAAEDSAEWTIHDQCSYVGYIAERSMRARYGGVPLGEIIQEMNSQYVIPLHTIIAVAAYSDEMAGIYVGLGRDFRDEKIAMVAEFRARWETDCYVANTQ